MPDVVFASWLPFFPNTQSDLIGKLVMVSDMTGHSQITLFDLRTLEFTRITDNRFIEYDPEWMPNGTQIIFSSDTVDLNGHFSPKLFLANIQNGVVTEVKTNPAITGQPDPSPDGNYILISGTNFSADVDIFTFDLDNNEYVNVSNSLGDDQYPDWSPDGKQIAFSSNRNGNWDIYTINKDGSNLEQITTAAGNNIEPKWSSDGKQIVFSSDRSGSWEIYTMLIGGTMIDQITFSGSNNSQPTWSPDSGMIAFVSETTSGYHDLYIYVLASGQLINMTPGPNYDYQSPSWIK